MILFFNLVISHPSSAQDERIKEVYTKNVITFYGERQFLRNNQLLKYKEVVPLLKSFPASELEYSVAHKNNTMGRILAIPAFASIILFFTQSNRNNDPAWGFGIASIGFFGASELFLDKGHKHLQKSVWLYNRDIMIKKFQ